MRRQDAVFAEWVDAYGGAISRLAAAFERNPAVRAELVQDILMALWTALPTFRGDANARTFVLRIAHNRAASHVVSESRRPRTAELSAATGEQVPDESADPLLGAQRRQQAQQLTRAVAALAPAQRQIVTLALEGLAYAEIAEVLDVSVNLVGVRLTRAKAALRAQLEAGDE